MQWKKFFSSITMKMLDVKFELVILPLLQVEGLKARMKVLDSMDERLKFLDDFNKKLKVFDTVLKEMEEWNVKGRQRMDDLLKVQKHETYKHAHITNLQRAYYSEQLTIYFRMEQNLRLGGKLRHFLSITFAVRNSQY